LKPAEPTASVGSNVADVNWSAFKDSQAERRVSPNGVTITDTLGLGHLPILRH